MLKLKNAVNSFVLTKKKFDKKKNKKKTIRMRGGGVFSFGKKTPEQQKKIDEQKEKENYRKQRKINEDNVEKILKALEKAIQRDFDNCLVGLDKALPNQTSPDSKIIFHKAKIHIPVVRENLNNVENLIKNFSYSKSLRNSLIDDIKKKRDDLKVKQTALNQITLEDKDVPPGIREVYTPEDINEASEVSNIFKLIHFDDKGGISKIDYEKISQTVKEANNKYKYFLELVENARKSNPRERTSMLSRVSSRFSFGKKSVKPLAQDTEAVKTLDPASGPPPPPPPPPKALNPPPASGPPLDPASRSVNPPPSPPPPAEAVKSGTSVGQSVGQREFSVTTKPGCNTNSCDVHITQKGITQKDITQNGGSRKSKRSKTLKGGRRRR